MTDGPDQGAPPELNDAARHLGAAAPALIRLGQTWWVWVFLGGFSGGFTFRSSAVTLSSGLIAGPFVVAALGRLPAYAPQSIASRLVAVVAFGGAVVALEFAGVVDSPGRPAFAVAAAVAGAVGLGLYTGAMTQWTKDAGAAALAGQWHRAMVWIRRSWCAGAVAGLALLVIWATAGTPELIVVVLVTLPSAFFGVAALVSLGTSSSATNRWARQLHDAGISV